MRTKQELVNDLFWTLSKKDTAQNRKEIMHLLGYKNKNPHVLKILEGLVQENYIIRIDSQLGNGLPVFYYYVNQTKKDLLAN